MNQSDLDLANRLYERSQYGEAAKAYLRLLEESGGEVAGTGQVLHRLGNCFFFEKDYGRALSAYDQALKDTEYHDQAKIWFNKALCFVTIGDFDAALLCYDRVLVDPAYATPHKAHYNRGNVLVELGRLEHAVEEFRTAAADPANESPAGAYNNAGLALMAIGRYEEAADAFGKAAKDPGYANRQAALLHRAEAWDTAGLEKLALDAYDEALAAGVELTPERAARAQELREVLGPQAAEPAVPLPAAAEPAPPPEVVAAAPPAPEAPAALERAPAPEVVAEAPPAPEAPAPSAEEAPAPAPAAEVAATATGMDLAAFRSPAAPPEPEAASGMQTIDLGGIVAASMAPAPAEAAAGTHLEAPPEVEQAEVAAAAEAPPAPEAPAAEKVEAPPAVKPFWEGAPPAEAGGEEAERRRTPEEVARAYREAISPEEDAEFQRQRKLKRRWRVVRTIAIVLVVALTVTAAGFALAYFVYDWGAPSRETVIHGSVDAWAGGQTQKVRTYVLGGDAPIIDEFKAIPLPVLKVAVERYERIPQGSRAIVVVTSGKQTANAALRYVFELKRVGLGWKITRVALL